jgi:hypothetical protein
MRETVPSWRDRVIGGKSKHWILKSKSPRSWLWSES